MIKDFKTGEVTHVGTTINIYDKYYLDGMIEEYAVVYDTTNKKLETIIIGYYGNDYTNVIHKNATIDCTPSIAREVVKNIYKVEAIDLYKLCVKAINTIIQKGDVVEVIKGRKVTKGTTGTVFWVGEKYNSYSNSTELIVGFRTENSDKPMWVQAKYLKKIVPIKPIKDNKKLRKMFIEYVYNYKLYNNNSENIYKLAITRDNMPKYTYHSNIKIIYNIFGDVKKLLDTYNKYYNAD